MFLFNLPCEIVGPQEVVAPLAEPGSSVPSQKVALGHQQEHLTPGAVGRNSTCHELGPR